MSELFQGDRPEPFTLHPFQKQCVANTYEAIRQGARRVLFVQPTGTGKTITFAQMVRDCTVVRGRPSLVVAHREELIDQAVDKLHRQTGIRAEVEKAERRADRERSRIVVGCVPTMRGARLAEWNRGHFGLVVTDEAHHAYADSWQALIDRFGGTEEEVASGEHAGAVVVGCTATPDRGDRKNLGKVFQVIAFNYPLTHAIRDGYLCPIKGLTVEEFAISMADVRVSHGDYVAADLEALLLPQLTEIAEAIVEHTRDRQRTLAFLPLVGSSKAMAEKLRELGVRADEVNGETPTEERRRKLEDFRAGRITHMVNCMVLTEGYDHPAIDCIVNCRPTRSRGLFAQMVGRGTRTAPGKDDMLLINFDWQQSHNLVSPYELFVDDDIGDDARALAEAEPVPGGGQQIDFMERLMAAVKRRTDPDVLHSRLTLRDYDPLDLLRLGGHEPDSELNIRWRAPNGQTYHLSEEAGTASEKQVRFLRYLGMRAADDTLSKAHASALISTVMEHAGRSPGAFATTREKLYAERAGGSENE